MAAGVVFTTPAFLFIAGGADYFEYLQITTLAAAGGVLGVLLMVPMRRALGTSAMRIDHAPLLLDLDGQALG